jgi:hypothetical protein
VRGIPSAGVVALLATALQVSTSSASAQATTDAVVAPHAIQTAVAAPPPRDRPACKVVDGAACILLQGDFGITTYDSAPAKPELLSFGFATSVAGASPVRARGRATAATTGRAHESTTAEPSLRDAMDMTRTSGRRKRATLTGAAIGSVVGGLAGTFFGLQLRENRTVSQAFSEGDVWPFIVGGAAGGALVGAAIGAVTHR